MLIFCLLYIYHHRLVEHLIQYVLSLQSYSKWFYVFSNSFSSSIQKDINLLFLSLFSSSAWNALTYLLPLGNIKTNGLITLSNYPIKYLELVFVSTYFEMTILSTLTSGFFFFFFFFCTIKYFFSYFYFAKSQHYYTINKIFVITFWLIDRNLFLRIYYSSSDINPY